jgi:hypothetical protein
MTIGGGAICACATAPSRKKKVALNTVNARHVMLGSQKPKTQPIGKPHRRCNVLPQAPMRFVALAFILRKMRATMVNARFSSRRNVALIRPD